MRVNLPVTHLAKFYSPRPILWPDLWPLKIGTLAKISGEHSPVICPKKLVEKTWFLAIMEGNRCVTYSDDGTGVEMFVGLATVEK